MATSTCSTIPSVFLHPIDAEEWTSVRDYLLDRLESTLTLTFVLRMGLNQARELDEHAQWDYWYDGLVRQSLFSGLREVIPVWHELAGVDSCWSPHIELPGVHAFGIRAPARMLLRFIDDPAIRASDSPIGSVVLPIQIGSPERLSVQESIRNLDNRVDDQIARIREQLAGVNDLRNLEREVLALLQEPEVVAALDMLQMLRSIFPRRKSRAAREKTRRVVTKITDGEFLDGLGVGRISRFGPDAGRNVKICILDSGADESMPMLRRKVIDYARFDPHSQGKRAHDCIDAGCHGTKIASIICGSSVRLSDVGLDDLDDDPALQSKLASYKQENGDRFRLGLAPGAKIGVVGVLSGSPLSETGTASQLLSGIDWLVQHAFEGYQLANFSMEADPDAVNSQTMITIDQMLGVLKRRGVFPVIAVGNRENCKPIGSKGLVVGAYGGEKDADNVNLLAPGKDVLCGQPSLDCLGGLQVDCHSGSSLATAVVTGLMADLLSAFPTCSADDVADSLKVTASDRLVQVDAACDELGRRS